jgi:DNA/RNA-binding domain of Phe-tRNA-synthetase-like protein
MIDVAPHSLLDLQAFITEFPKPLGEMSSPESLMALLSFDADAPMQVDDTVKPIVRDLLRQGGYKPTGRGKPASEYLRQAVEKGKLSSINLIVDACNVVSFHSGLPISVVDLDLVQEPLKIGLAPENSEYVFNASGQTIKLDGLLCLFDTVGPCANGVKDCQRTKTSDSTRRTLTVVWGTNQLAGRSEQAAKWYRELVENEGAETREIDMPD